MTRKGHKQIYKSEESRLKSLDNLNGKGSTPWNKGTKGLMNPWNKGKKGLQFHTEEFKEARRQRWLGKNNPNAGKFGKNHSVWKEEKKRPLFKSIRTLHEYVVWRTANFQRDDYTCVQCLVKGGELQVDHYPKRFIDIIMEYEIETIEDAIACKELWDVANGRTLCLKCHRKTPTWGRKS